MLHWLYVQADQPFDVPRDVLDVPGVRYTAPDAGYSLHRCELPFTVWHLEPVQRWLTALGTKAPRSDKASFEPDFRGSTLFEHQKEAVRFLVLKRAAVLGSEMGLGKTRCALTAAAVLYTGTELLGSTAGPVLIVAPKSLRTTWERELLATGIPGSDSFVALEGVTPMAEKLVGKRWIFCHYDILRAWWSQIAMQRPLVGILDEAHLVKDARTKRGKAVQLALSSTPYRFVLTGTPILNRVPDFWLLLQLATGPWTWGTPSSFRERYAGAYFDGHGLKDGKEVTNKEELQQRLTCCYLRRTVDEVGLALPPLTQQVIEADVDEANRVRHQKIIETAESRAVSIDDMVNAILQRRASKAALDFMGKLRKLTSSIKVPTTLAHVESIVLQGESVVVFTWTREMAERLAGRIDYSMGGRVLPGVIEFVHGRVPHTRRQEIVDRFQARGGVIVATIDALSVGVTLHKARHVVIHDLDPVPNKMLQALGRVRRIGQVWPTTGTFVFAPNTIDEIYARIIRRKSGLIADASGDEGPQALSDLLEPSEVYAGMTRLLDWVRRAA